MCSCAFSGRIPNETSVSSTFPESTLRSRESFEPVNSLHSGLLPTYPKPLVEATRLLPKLLPKAHNTCWCTTLTWPPVARPIGTYTKGHLTAGPKIPFK
ncbi:hypothetical protein TNCV_1612971 [Trichonephila clavipes]|nr:hypothetical protein TNCV_1612971 [Trichonephila clavipes]